VQIPTRGGASGGRLLLPVTLPVADAIVKLAVQLVTVPVGGVPALTCGPSVTVPVSVYVPTYGPAAGPVAW
jgi:hypothetical protein